MAAGDIVNDVQSIANGANLDFQPSAGVDVIITHVGGAKDGSVNIQMYDGSNAGTIISSDGMSTANVKIGINNTNYLRISNGSGGGVVCSYSGIQTG